MYAKSLKIGTNESLTVIALSEARAIARAVTVCQMTSNLKLARACMRSLANRLLPYRNRCFLVSTPIIRTIGRLNESTQIFHSRKFMAMRAKSLKIVHSRKFFSRKFLRAKVSSLKVLLVHGRVQIAPNFTKNWDGRHFLTVVGAGAFSRYTKLKSTRPLLILKINYLHTVDPCIDLTLIPFKR